MTVLQTAGLRKVYGAGDTEVRALDGVDLTVESGEFVAVVGTSGSGKSTLLHMLGGLDRPTSGKVYVDGNDIFALKDDELTIFRRRRIGFVFQAYNLVPVLSVYENIVLPIELDGGTVDQSYVDEIIRTLGLESKLANLPSQLSGGQQQRVAIARALVSSDDVIVMDEPITNLDAKLREEMLEEIRIIQRDIGTTILYITHDQEAALQLCDKMAIMDREGNLCQIGHDEDIILTPANRFVFEFIGVSNFLPMIHKDGHTYISAGKEYLYDDCPADIFMTGKAMEMGIRPNDIVYDNSSSVRGIVKSSVFLGSEYTYFVTLGDRELRVQANALEVMKRGNVEEGQEVGLRFLQPRYYESKTAE